MIDGGPYLPWMRTYSSEGTPLSEGYLEMPLPKGSAGDVRDLAVDSAGNLVITVDAYDISRAQNVALLRKQVI